MEFVEKVSNSPVANDADRGHFDRRVQPEGDKTS